MITTGPGLMSPIATASTNCCWVNQPWSSTSPACRNGTTARPEPNVNAPALKKNHPRQRRAGSRPRESLHGGEQRDRRDCADAPVTRQPPAVVGGAERAGQQEQPHELGAGDHRRGAQ